MKRDVDAIGPGLKFSHVMLKWRENPTFYPFGDQVLPQGTRAHQLPPVGIQPRPELGNAFSDRIGGANQESRT